MLFSYQECLLKYRSDYQIKKAIKKKELYQIEKGIYSDSKVVSPTEVLAKKYPNAIVTMHSAFYYYGLTNTIPEYSYLATDRNAAKIRDNRVKQCFIPKDVLELGVVEEVQKDITIRIYSKERMLIELVRNKSKLPYDYYKEIIKCYRSMVDKLDIQEIQKASLIFPKSSKIMKRLQSEVF